jgi:hypothetical protein
MSVADCDSQFKLLLTGLARLLYSGPLVHVYGHGSRGRGIQGLTSNFKIPMPRGRISSLTNLNEPMCIQHCLLSCLASNCYIQLAAQHDNDPRVLFTRTFLLEHESGSHITDMEKMQRAVEHHQNSFTSLLKNCKSEWVLTCAATEKVTPSEFQVVIYRGESHTKMPWTVSIVLDST